MRLVGWAKRKVAESKCPAELAEVDKTAEVVRQKASVPFSAMRDDTALSRWVRTIPGFPANDPAAHVSGIDKGEIT